MDGTVDIYKSFCRSAAREAEGSATQKCEAWLARAIRDLGSQLERSNPCPREYPNDIFGCEYISYVQLNCRLTPNRNLRPNSCLDAVGDVINSADELRNCLWEWAFKERGGKIHEETAVQSAEALKTFSPKLKEIYACVGVTSRNQNHCLFDLAIKFRDRRLCELNSDPYTKVYSEDPREEARLRKSRPNCLARVP